MLIEVEIILSLLARNDSFESDAGESAPRPENA
jgi:hypothetical protein